MINAAITPRVEQLVITQLSNYQDIVDRLRVLQTYSVGNGITVSRLSEDDHLQDLHRKLRGMPRYMYLTMKEQKLEQTVNAYLFNHPAGTRAQLKAIQECRPVDRKDEKALQEVIQKISRVVEARAGRRDDLAEVLERVAKFQDLQAEKDQIDKVLEVMKEQYAHFADLLRLHYIEKKSWKEITMIMGISKSVFYRWRPRALEKYAHLAGWE
ncbi:RNA polymerase subunit sigma-24 [Aneurinibacillus aneurinilyticus]|uniref:RNA polymerase subunit sigma-24 n=1 Tax=Aneurinibacillus aneurinilyticus TaxID=1391 RepID=UPI002E23728D|nr:RNA polymerase subunit sigma-24 [Aneurinibacillus aneurinilyticus]